MAESVWVLSSRPADELLWTFVGVFSSIDTLRQVQPGPWRVTTGALPVWLMDLHQPLSWTGKKPDGPETRLWEYEAREHPVDAGVLR